MGVYGQLRWASDAAFGPIVRKIQRIGQSRYYGVMVPSDEIVEGVRQRTHFETTRWSKVLAAGHPSSPRHREALSELCRDYWYPLYVYLRRRGFDPHQSEDYVQGFFAWTLEKDALGKADRDRGKFRSFLLTSLKNFVANEHDRAQALKRGGGKTPLSLDFTNAEGQYTLEPAHDLTPDKLFDRSWALELLNAAMKRLETRYDEAGKAQEFSFLKEYLTAKKGDVSYREVGARLHMSEGAVKVAVHRLRKRYRELLRAEIAETVTSEDRIEEEIQDLFEALS